MKTIKYIFIITLAAIFALSSCKTKTAGTAQAEQTAPLTNENALDTIAASYGEWTDVKMPVKVELQQPKKFSISGNLSMVAGEAISVSLRFFGMEVGRIYADNDSVIVVAKPMYYTESTARFTAAAGFTLSDMQAMILGRAFSPGQGQLNTRNINDFTTSALSDGEYMIAPKAQAKDAGYFYTATFGSSPAVTGMAVEVAGHNPVLCNFADIQPTPLGPVASKIRLRASAAGHAIDCTLNTTPAKAEWNKGVNVARPTIPRDGRRLSTAQVINMLKSL